eukprot:gene8228-1494_t
MTAFAPGFAPGFARFRSTNNQVRGLDCTTAALALYCDYSDLSLSPPTSLRVHLTPSLKIRPKVQFSSQGPVEWNSEFLSSTHYIHSGSTTSTLAALHPLWQHYIHWQHFIHLEYQLGNVSAAMQNEIYPPNAQHRLPCGRECVMPCQAVNVKLQIPRRSILLITDLFSSLVAPRTRTFRHSNCMSSSRDSFDRGSRSYPGSVEGASLLGRSSTGEIQLKRTSCGYSNTRGSENEGFIDIGCSSLTGNRYGDLQQDFMVIQEMYAKGEIPKGGKQTYIAAVTDGHGIIGDKCASFAGKALARYLYSSLVVRNKILAQVDAQDVEKVMKDAFAKGHNAALSLYSSPVHKLLYPKKAGMKKLVEYTVETVQNEQVYRCAGSSAKHHIEGGCTATAALVQGHFLVLANVGDSHAVLGFDDGHRNFTGKILTTHHHGKHPEERIREGPWMGYELSVTRALGHKNMEQYGVMFQPSVIHMQLEARTHCCLIIASDGVWDQMSADEAVQHVMATVNRGLGAEAAALALVERCVELGLASEVEEADNTSAVVLLFLSI